MDRIKNIKRYILNKLQKIKFLQFIFFKKNEFKFTINDYNSYIYKNVNFVNSPFIFYIKHNLDFILENNIKYLNDLKLYPLIGIEIEFYSLLKSINVSKMFIDINKFSLDNDIQLLSIDRENGNNQFEIRLKPYYNIYKLFNDYDNLKIFLTNSEYEITFENSPFCYDVGSALQINVSLSDRNYNNVFARSFSNGKKVESLFMLYSIAGLLETTNIFLPLYIKDKDTIARFNKDINKLLYSNGKIPAPSFNCWGVNNRTCSVRIPVPKNIIDLQNYEENDNKNRRIEFRVPSSDSDIKSVICGVICAISYGIKNEILPQKSTSNNMFDDFGNYSQIKLTNCKFIKDLIFNINQ